MDHTAQFWVMKVKVGNDQEKAQPERDSQPKD